MKKVAFILILSTAIAQAQSTDLDVRNLQVVSEGNGISAITGTATNQTDRELTAAFVKFNLLDERGALVGNAMATASDLAPGQTWKFEAETPVRFATAKLSGVEVFPPR
jgi:hypothetical protein